MTRKSSTELANKYWQEGWKGVAVKYDSVYRYNRCMFTGVPIAKLHDNVWYWPDYQTAHDFAVAFDLPVDCIKEYANGWAQAAVAPATNDPVVLRFKVPGSTVEIG
jgi:hypothetical protein